MLLGYPAERLQKFQVFEAVNRERITGIAATQIKVEVDYDLFRINPAGPARVFNEEGAPPQQLLAPAGKTTECRGRAPG